MNIKVLASMFLCAVLAAPTALGFLGSPIFSYGEGGVVHLLKTIRMLTPDHIAVICKLDFGQIIAIRLRDSKHRGLDFKQFKAVHSLNLAQLVAIRDLNPDQVELIRLMSHNQIEAIRNLDDDALDVIRQMTETKD